MADGGEKAARLVLRTFGATTLSTPEGETFAGLGAKALGLLVHVAANQPAPVTRDALVDLLWERVDPSQGKGSLRQELRRFKKVLGEELYESGLHVTDQHVGFRGQALIFDAELLEVAAKSDDADEIAAILDIYRGEFLADNAARAEPFQDWAAERRAFYEDMALAALTRLAFLDLEAGRLERCQQAADWVIQVDPLQEQAQEALIRCHLASGRRGQARSVFEVFRARLLREIGAEPSEALASLVSPASDGVAAPARRTAPQPVTPDSEPPTIAVMNVSPTGGDDQGYLAAGLVEELVANMARSSWMKVASLNAPFAPRETGVEMAQRDLRDAADYILRLAVQVAGERAVVVATLNRVADNETLFSETMHEKSDDILFVQGRIATTIATVFEEKVIGDQGELVKNLDWNQPEDMDHWRTVMRARWLFWQTSRRANAEAQRLLSDAVRRKRDDAAAYCLLAFSAMLDGWCGWTPDPFAAFATARDHAEKAVRVNPNDAWAQFTLGVACSTRSGLLEAKSRLVHALKLAPSFVAAKGDLARISVFLDELDQAVRLADEAMALSPYDQHYGLFIRTKSIAAWMRENHDEALELIDYSLVVRPGWFQNHFLRAAILAEQGRREEAERAYATGEKFIGPYSPAAFALGHPFKDDVMFDRFADALRRAGGRFEIGLEKGIRHG